MEVLLLSKETVKGDSLCLEQGDIGASTKNPGLVQIPVKLNSPLEVKFSENLKNP